jgi:hypothetical protein
MQQRYYDQSIGRFLSVDPVTAHEKPGQNFNRYWYANNSPYKFVDPDGRQVAINNNQPGTPGWTYANRYQQGPNELAMSNHGDNRGVWDDSGRVSADSQEGRVHLGPQGVADQFTALDSYTPDKTLVLLNCNAGTGENSLAQQVADITGNPVEAYASRVVATGGPNGGFMGFDDQNNNRIKDPGEPATERIRFEPRTRRNDEVTGQ